MSKRILITGISGFIGRFLVEEAIQRNYEVYGTVRKTSHIEHLLKNNIEFLEIDFSDKNELGKLFQVLPVFDYIIHNAGLTQTLNIDEYYQVNVGLTRNFIEVLKKTEKIPRKFIYISSLAAYGPGKPNSNEPLTQNDLPFPITHYGKSKLEAEKFVSLSGIPFIVFRPTAVYGPGEKNLFQSVKLANKGFSFKIGKENQTLTFIHAFDLAHLIFDGLESPYINRSYFATDGNTYSFEDFKNAVSIALDKKLRSFALPIKLAKKIAATNEWIAKINGKAPALTVDKVNELSATNWNCDCSPLKTDFDFLPKYNLFSGMKECIQWYREEGWL